jgi:hypothetical protein
MSRIKILLIVLTFSDFFASAQKRNFEIGVSGGANFSGLWGYTQIIKPNTLVATNYQIELGFKLNEHFFLVSNNSYETKGIQFNDIQITDINGNQLSNGTTKVKLDYINFDLLARYMIDSKKVKYYANAGPYFGLFMKGTEESKLSSPTMINGTSFSNQQKSINNQFKKIDYGLSLGAGVWLPLNENINFTFGLTGNIGLNNISSYPVIDDGSIRTKNIKFSIGINHLF